MDCYLGKVKWFSNKAGYGFITVLKDPDQKPADAPNDLPETLVNEDIFIHHSGISSEKQVYKYLLQDELVQLKILFLSSSNHKYQAYEVTGNNVELECENSDRINERQTRLNAGRGRGRGRDGRGRGRGMRMSDGKGYGGRNDYKKTQEDKFELKTEQFPELLSKHNFDENLDKNIQSQHENSQVEETTVLDDTVPVDTVPVDTVLVDTVPVDTVPVDKAPIGE